MFQDGSFLRLYDVLKYTQGLTCSKAGMNWTPALPWSINSKILSTTLTVGKIHEVSFDPGTHP